MHGPRHAARIAGDRVVSAPAIPENLGRTDVATEGVTSGLSERRARSTILLLAASVGIVMTGYGIIMPVFARRLGEFGSGVEALGLMTMSFALAQFVAAPFMGTLADRFGRRPLILTALGAYVVANIGFLLAPTVAVFTAIRALEGALTAGLFPAAMGVVGDVVPDRQRAQWVGIVMGSYGAGFIFGPVIGGVLYDGWGFAAPFVASAVLAAAALAAASVLVPETRPREARRRAALRRQQAAAQGLTASETVWSSLPRPLYFFGTLLALDFGGVFAFAYVEPQMVFYFYDELGWSTVRFGVVAGVYGLAMVIGQAGLGKASDRFGRKPIILVGLLLTTTFYFGVGFITSFPLMLLVALAAGMGGALMAPGVECPVSRHHRRATPLAGGRDQGIVGVPGRRSRTVARRAVERPAHTPRYLHQRRWGGAGVGCARHHRAALATRRCRRAAGHSWG